MINLGILRNLCISIAISIHPVYPGSLAKDLLQQVNSEECGFSILHRFCSPSKKRPLGSYSLVVYPEGAQTENSIIRGSNLKGHKPPSWMSVNLSDTFKAQMKQKKHSFCVTISRREKGWAQSIISLWGIWSSLTWVSVKILMTLFWFLQNSGTRSCFRGSLMAPTWSYISSCSNHRKTREKKLFNSVSPFAL